MSSELVTTTHINKKQCTGIDATTMAVHNWNDSTPLATAYPQINGSKSILPAPTMKLTGHTSYVYTAQFSSDGLYLASAGNDQQLLIWSINNSCNNISVLKGHNKAITQLQWVDDMVYTCSADNSVQLFDIQNESRIKKITRIHTQCINTVTYNNKYGLLFSGSDDCRSCGIDTRNSYKSTHGITQQYPILSIDSNDNDIYVAGIDNQIYCYDIRKLDNINNTSDTVTQPVYTLYGHNDSVTGISVSHNKQYLCSTSHDQSIIIHDINPYIQTNKTRLLHQFNGGVHDKQMNLLRCHWSSNDKYISCGSSNTITYIFNTQTGTIQHQLPGHTGSVNEIDFHPTQSIIASCSNDATLLVGEIEL